MVVIVFNGWEMIVPSSVANDPIERAKVIELLQQINEVAEGSE